MPHALLGNRVTCYVKRPRVSDVGTSVAASQMHQTVPKTFLGGGEKQHLLCSALTRDGGVCPCWHHPPWHHPCRHHPHRWLWAATMAVPSAQAPSLRCPGVTQTPAFWRPFTQLFTVTGAAALHTQLFSCTAKQGGCVPGGCRGLRPQGHPGVLQQCEAQGSPSPGLIPPQEVLLAGR